MTLHKTYFAPVDSTVSSPNSDFAVASQAARLQASPSGGERAAAQTFCLFHSSVKAAGSTAEPVQLISN
jgi:hypothetical protein